MSRKLQTYSDEWYIEWNQPSSRMVKDPGGEWYSKEEVDAEFQDLEDEIAQLKRHNKRYVRKVRRAIRKRS
jgi:hypothetical protein